MKNLIYIKVVRRMGRKKNE